MEGVELLRRPAWGRRQESSKKDDTVSAFRALEGVDGNHSPGIRTSSGRGLMPTFEGLPFCFVPSSASYPPLSRAHPCLVLFAYRRGILLDLRHGPRHDVRHGGKKKWCVMTHMARFVRLKRVTVAFSAMNFRRFQAADGYLR